MYQYEEIVTLANMIDTMCEAIISSEKSESKDSKWKLITHAAM